MSKIMPTSRRIKIEEDNITRKKKKTGINSVISIKCST